MNVNTATHTNAPKTKPFLKWAGGKRWLVASHSYLFPECYNTYHEPFVGSGAVYFHLQPHKAVLNDLNYSLINSYNVIKNNWKELYKTLKSFDRLHNEEFYYEIRSKKFRSDIRKAAQFIYLNRTCWNGLYRVNLNGAFNVPIGTKENVILNTDNFEETSRLLKKTKLLNLDFEKIINESKKNDFIFIDPPYTVKHNLNGFVKYNEKLFSWDDQLRLRHSVEDAASRGVKILMTNANHASIRKIYDGFGVIKKLNRTSIISGDKNKREKTSELIIQCY